MEIASVNYTVDEVREALRKAFEPNIGSIWAGGNTTPTAVTLASTFYAVDMSGGTIDDNVLRGFTRTGSTLTCTAAGTYFIFANVCFSSPGNNTHLRMRIGINGTSLASTCSGTTLAGTGGGTRRESAGTHTYVALEVGDTVDIMIGNFTDTTDPVVSNIQLSAKEV